VLDLELENFAEVAQGLELWLEATEDLADDVYRGIAVQALKYVVQGTPEFTGNLAASWRLTVGAPAVSYVETPFKELDLGGTALDPAPFSRQQPNYAAIQYAFSIAKEQVALVRLGADVFISNAAPYAENVAENRREDGKVGFIRQVNLPIEMVHAAYDKFSALGVIGLAKAAALKAERL
jgi:hypothetical protein